MTEMVTGVDLIQEQIRVAMDHRLKFRQEDIVLKVRSLARTPCHASHALPGASVRGELVS